MEMMRKGSRIGADSRPSPRWEAALNREMKFRNMRPSGSLAWTRSRRRCGRGVTLRQVRGDDLVDLRLRVRLEPYRDGFVCAPTLHDDPQCSDVPHAREDALEVLDRRLRHRLSVDRNQPVARLELSALGRTIGNNGFDHDARFQIDHRQAEIAAPGEHLPDLLLALLRRCAAVFRFIGMEESTGREAGDEQREDTEFHGGYSGSLGRRQLYADSSGGADNKSENVGRIPCEDRS